MLESYKMTICYYNFFESSGAVEKYSKYVTEISNLMYVDTSYLQECIDFLIHLIENCYFELYELYYSFYDDSNVNYKTHMYWQIQLYHILLG